MCPDKDVGFAGFELLHNRLLLLGRTKARHHFHDDWELGKATLKRFEVLKRKNSRWCKHRHLLAVLHSLERGAHGDFGFAVSHVAAEETVHRGRGFHVLLDRRYRSELIVGLAIVERALELALKFVVRRKRRSLCGV